ncbi:phosphodiester glycosidase family protein [Kamptonema cortianum]|nr:phosphodiester glycosidase family protein [Kamptonema cortianum]
MRMIPWGIAAIAILVIPAEAKGFDGASYSVFKSESAWYHSVVADLNRTHITPTAHYSPRLTYASKAIAERQPIAAITWHLLLLRNHQPVADVVIDGVAKAYGNRGSVLAVDWFGNAKIIDVPVRQDMDFFAYRYALRGMVRIVSSGKVGANPRAQGFRDPAISGSAARTAVGLTKNNKIILVATSQHVTLSELGRAMVARGAHDAVCLDGGGSTMLYFMGSIKVEPKRPLSTLFMIENRSPYDDTFKAHMSRIGWNQASGAAAKALAQASGQ